MNFLKLTSAGNDFVCIDSMDNSLNDLLKNRDSSIRFARAVCQRGHGIGADGVVIALPDTRGDADLAAVTLEADGSECEMCGNGMACISCFSMISGIASPGGVTVSTPAGLVNSRKIEEDRLRITIPRPIDYKPDIQLDIDSATVECDFVIAGIPHVAIFVQNIDNVDVVGIGRQVRYHPAFGPRGVNVNFVQMVGEGDIAIRTYEFGVEDETLSCGSGSCASAILSARRFEWSNIYTSGKQPVRVHVRSGKILKVYPDINNEIIQGAAFETQVLKVMKGQISQRWLKKLCLRHSEEQCYSV